MKLEHKLKNMGLIVPEAAQPVGAYVVAVATGDLAFTSGQLPIVDGQLKYAGKIGGTLTEEDGYHAAAICALNCLAALKHLVGDLTRVRRIIKVTGFVNCTPEFTAQAKVINGASELLGKLFDVGHARSAVGVASLPLGAAVEIEVVAEIIPG